MPAQPSPVRIDQSARYKPTIQLPRKMNEIKLNNSNKIDPHNLNMTQLTAFMLWPSINGHFLGYIIQRGIFCSKIGPWDFY
jgi:hypothetical protein